MKKAILILAAVLFVSGCSIVGFERTMLDGTKVKAGYCRWGWQKIKGFELSIEPNDTWNVKFNEQVSETELAFKLGVMSAGIGRGAK